MQHDVEHALVLVGELVLPQLAEPLVGIDRHLARRRLELAAEDLHERRLAAAVGADQAVAIAAAELDGDVLEQGLGPELHRDIGGNQHGKTPRQTVYSARINDLTQGLHARAGRCLRPAMHA